MITYESAKLNQQEIVSDYFNDNDLGQWVNYKVIDDNQRSGLLAQKHTDIRSFYPAIYADSYIIDLVDYTMASLVNTDVSNIQPSITIRSAESWIKDSTTATSATATIGTSSDGWSQLEVAIVGSGTTVVSSTQNAIDISGYASTDYISVALPSVPSQLTLASCYIKFSDGTNTNSIKFTDAGVTSSGNNELKFPLSLLNSVNKARITKISFEIVTTGNCTFKCMIVRCITSNWKYAPIDLNTLEDTVVKTVPPNGSISSSTINFPTNENGANLPTAWPVLYRSFSPEAKLTYENDLKITNASISTVIYTGTSVGTNSTDINYNVFSYYFRNKPRQVTQSELNQKKQSNLNQTRPENLIALYSPLTQSKITKIPGAKAADTFPVGWGISQPYQYNPSSLPNADGKLQSDISKIGGQFANTSFPVSWGISEPYQYNPYSLPNANGWLQKDFQQAINTNQLSYTAAHLRWYLSGGNLTFKVVFSDELSDLFVFPQDVPIEDWQNKTLVFRLEFVDNTVRCKLFELKNNRLILFFDTGAVETDLFHREAGDFGWFANFKDGGTKIQSIRSGGIVYGEYKSSPMDSFTPVKGAQIFANYTKDKELVTDIGSNKWSIGKNSLSTEIDRTDSKHPVTVYTITNVNNHFWQGIGTNQFKIEDVQDIYIKFDIKFPSNSDNITAFLYDQNINRLVELHVPPFKKNQWTTVKIFLQNGNFLPGYHQLVIAQKDYTNNTPWSIKNISIKQRMITWDLRSYVDGPWSYDTSDWIRNFVVDSIPSNDFTNSLNNRDGALFNKQGSELQVRALAKNQFVKIHNFDILPKYATLGNFVWRD